jgi:hypothetical protein
MKERSFRLRLKKALNNNKKSFTKSFFSQILMPQFDTFSFFSQLF